MTATTHAAALTHRADCADCEWTAEVDTWAALDRAADRHARTGHVVTALTLPAVTP